MAEAVAIIGLIVGAAGTASSIRSNKKAQQAQEKSDDINQRQTDLENQRRIRQSVEQARVERAKVIASATVSGTSDGSAVAGGLGSAATQNAANVGFARQAAEANASANRQIGKARGFTTRANTAQAIGNLPSQFGIDSSELFK